MERYTTQKRCKNIFRISLVLLINSNTSIIPHNSFPEDTPATTQKLRKLTIFKFYKIIFTISLLDFASCSKLANSESLTSSELGNSLLLFHSPNSNFRLCHRQTSHLVTKSTTPISQYTQPQSWPDRPSLRLFTSVSEQTPS